RTHHRLGDDRRVPGHRHDGWALYRRRSPAARNHGAAANEDVLAGRVDRRQLPDRRGGGDDVRVRASVWKVRTGANANTGSLNAEDAKVSQKTQKTQKNSK